MSPKSPTLTNSLNAIAKCILSIIKKVDVSELHRGDIYSELSVCYLSKRTKWIRDVSPRGGRRWFYKG